MTRHNLTQNILRSLKLSGVGLVASALWLSGCDVDAKSLQRGDAHFLPEKAKIEKDLGNGWVVFSVDGRQYIYRYWLRGNATTEVLATY